MPQIECKENGPYLVKGLAELRNSKGEVITGQPVMALCRDRKSTRLNSSHSQQSRMPSSA